ncbi:MAG: GNAT family N-acetyltransferase [Spirulina sp. SIO3F2]|nr:GNAT family N-acetyltransferase [Spirulina sp. SIO3F2]
MNANANSAPSIKIRVIHREETAAVLELIHQSIRRINAQDYSPQEIDAIIDRMYTPQSITQGTYIVAECPSQLVGVIGFETCGTIGWINAVFTHPDFVRQGIGRMLVQEVEHRALNQGVVWLHVLSSRTAFEFYRALGYTEEDSILKYGFSIPLDKQLRTPSLTEQLFRTPFDISLSFIKWFS